MKTAILSTLLLSALAHATPADLFILIDTSGSMARPLGTGDARLTLAKQTARDVIAAVQNDHRVGLARYAQLERVLPGGEGKRAVLGEDPLQCDHGSNLLAGMDVAGANEALRWLMASKRWATPSWFRWATRRSSVVWRSLSSTSGTNGEPIRSGIA